MLLTGLWCTHNLNLSGCLGSVTQPSDNPAGWGCIRVSVFLHWCLHLLHPGPQWCNLSRRCICASGKWHTQAERSHQIIWFAIQCNPCFCTITLSSSTNKCSLEQMGSQKGCSGGLQISVSLKWLHMSGYFLNKILPSNGLRVGNWKGNSVLAIVTAKINDTSDTARLTDLTLHIVRNEHRHDKILESVNINTDQIHRSIQYYQS